MYFVLLLSYMFVQGLVMESGVDAFLVPQVCYIPLLFWLYVHRLAHSRYPNHIDFLHFSIADVVITITPTILGH